MQPLMLSLALSLLLCGASGEDGLTVIRTPAPRVVNLSGGNHARVAQRVRYQTYTNARYGYRVAYPASLLVPQGESDNGDGQKFAASDGSAVLTAYGSQRMERTLRDEFEAAQENRAVSYKVLKRGMFVVSGTENGKIFYQKTLLRGDVFKTFIIEYDEARRATFDPITTRIARSFVG